MSRPGSLATAELGESAGWSLILPLKPVRLAKSRLVGFPSSTRQDLVVAMARDVFEAVLASSVVEQIVVVTRDLCWQSRLGASRVRIVVESVDGSLNAALRLAAEVCRQARPDLGIAALTADLPALRTSELDSALSRASASTAFVPDAAGVGTTLLATPPSAQFVPRYGGRSRMAHRNSGARELVIPRSSGLRQDVDTVRDLRRAHALGVGRHTEAALASDWVRSWTSLLGPQRPRVTTHDLAT